MSTTTADEFAEKIFGYAAEAGFAGVDVLPIEDDFFRFYRLHP